MDVLFLIEMHQYTKSVTFVLSTYYTTPLHSGYLVFPGGKAAGAWC